MSSFSLKKIQSVNLTCQRSMQPLCLWLLKALNTNSWKDFWSKGDSSPFEKSSSFQISWTWSDVFWINENFIQQLSAMFTCRDGKDGELGNQALAEWIIVSYDELFDQSECPILIIYSPLEIILKFNIHLLKFLEELCFLVLALSLLVSKCLITNQMFFWKVMQLI